MKKVLRFFFPEEQFTGAWYNQKMYRVCAALGYIMFFVPLVMCPESRFGRFHANQSVINLLLITFGAVSCGFIPKIGWAISFFIVLMCVFNSIRGMIQALQFKAKSIPLFGRLNIISLGEDPHTY